MHAPTLSHRLLPLILVYVGNGGGMHIERNEMESPAQGRVGRFIIL